MNIKDEIFIDLVEQRPVIWNTRLKEYHNRKEEKKVWDELEELLHVPVQILKKRWHMLRSQYRRELNKYNQPTGSAAINHKMWRHFAQLSFLSDSFASRTMVGNMPIVQETEEYLDVSTDEDVPISQEDEQAPSQMLPKVGPTKPTTSSKKDLVAIANQLLNIEKDKVEKSTLNDSEFHFALSIVEPLKEVPKHNQLQVRMAIMDVISKFKEVEFD